MKLRLAPLLSSSNFHQQPDFILFERLIQVLHHFISLSFQLLRPNAFNYIPAQSSSLIPQLTRHFPLLETTFHRAPTTSITSHLILQTIIAAHQDVWKTRSISGYHHRWPEESKARTAPSSGQARSTCRQGHHSANWWCQEVDQTSQDCPQGWINWASSTTA